MGSSKFAKSFPLLPAWFVRSVVYLVGPARTATLAVLLVVAFAASACLALHYAWPHVWASGRFVVTPEQVSITPLPLWIHTDIRADVFRNASLDPPLSILDDNLVERIAEAFSLHPWVAKVVRATKRPGPHVEVEIVYRRPVCMVEIPSGLLPVDVEGVLLPSGDFSPLEAQSYPCLGGIDTRPMGPVGQRWGDPRVADAAEIAAAFSSVWQQLRLYRIQPTPRATSTPAAPTYELFTRAGTQIAWGPGPGSQTSGEPSPAEKVACLLSYATEHGSLDSPGRSQPLDVRQLPAKKN